MLEELNKCGECGAEKVDGLSCFERFGTVLSWEATDQELLGLHFWTVACYNLQHPAQFTDDAIKGLKEVFCEAYDKDVPISYIRKKMSRLTDGKFKVIKEQASEPKLVKWSMTISDIYNQKQPDRAADRVNQWRKTVREELDLLL